MFNENGVFPQLKVSGKYSSLQDRKSWGLHWTNIPGIKDNFVCFRLDKCGVPFFFRATRGLQLRLSEEDQVPFHLLKFQFYSEVYLIQGPQEACVWDKIGGVASIYDVVLGIKGKKDSTSLGLLNSLWQNSWTSWHSGRIFWPNLFFKIYWQSVNFFTYSYREWKWGQHFYPFWIPEPCSHFYLDLRSNSEFVSVPWNEALSDHCLYLVWISGLDVFWLQILAV